MYGEDAAPQSFDELSVRDVMTVDVKVVSPDATVSEAVKLMVESGSGSVVVVGPRREVLGILTERDVVRRVLYRDLNPRETKVLEVMSKPVVTVEPDVSIKEAARIMKEKGISHLPVVENGRLVGIVTEGDIASLAPDLLEISRLKRRREW